MKSKLLGLFLVLASPVLAGVHFGIGFGVGSPYYRGGGYGYYNRAPIVTYAPPVYAAPYAYGPSYYGPSAYGSGYYGPSAYGAYGAPPFAGAVWYAPRYYGGRSYRGYWGHRR